MMGPVDHYDAWQASHTKKIAEMTGSADHSGLRFRGVFPDWERGTPRLPPGFGSTPICLSGNEIMHIQTQKTFSGSRIAVRSITLFNLLIFVLFVIPPAHRWVDRGFLALQAIGFEEPVGYSLQIWLVGSTLLATGLLAWMTGKRRKTKATGLPRVSLRLEKILVAAWWLAALGACAYGFMLGGGG
jgi:hypothetical protein